MLRTRSWRRDGSSPAARRRPPAGGSSGAGRAAGRCRARSAPGRRHRARRSSPAAAARRRDHAAGQPDPGQRPSAASCSASTPGQASGRRARPHSVSARRRDPRLEERTVTGLDGPSWRTGEWPGATTRYGERRRGSRCESGAVPPLSPGSRPQPMATGAARKAGASADPGARRLPARRDPRPGARTRRKASAWSCCCPRPTPTCSRRARRGADYRLANPARLAPTSCPPCSRAPTWSSSGSSAARRAWQDGLDALLAGRRAGGGAGRRAGARRRADGAVHGAGRVAAEAHAYLAEGGPDNLGQLHAFLLRHGAADRRGLRRRRRRLPAWGVAGPGDAASTDGRADGRRPLLPGPPASRQHRVRRRARRRGRGRRRPARCRSSAPRCARADAELLDALAGLDALVVTVLAAGGTSPADGVGGRRRRGLGRRRAGRAGRPDPAGALPDQQPREPGRQRRRAVAAGRGHPGRDPGVRRPDHHRAVLVQGDRRRRAARATSPTPSGAARVAGIAVAHARLRHIPTAERRIALMLSAYPTKHSRIGNAVGLDTPAVAGAAAARDARGGRATTSASCPASPRPTTATR